MVEENVVGGMGGAKLPDLWAPPLAIPENPPLVGCHRGAAWQQRSQIPESFRSMLALIS